MERGYKIVELDFRDVGLKSFGVLQSIMAALQNQGFSVDGSCIGNFVRAENARGPNLSLDRSTHPSPAGKEQTRTPTHTHTHTHTHACVCV